MLRRRIYSIEEEKMMQAVEETRAREKRIGFPLNKGFGKKSGACKKSELRIDQIVGNQWMITEKQSESYGKV